MVLLIGKRFAVSRGSGESCPGDRLPIILAYGPAFGSGEHETTSSCLEELEGTPILATTRVLDLGCGTGILAVAAARMGSRSVMALDPSVDAFRTTSATVRMNGMSQFIIPVLGEIRTVKDKQFDLIMANLYGDVILQLVDEIASLLAPGGHLLLSGIQYADVYDVKTQFVRAGCTLLKVRYLEEYSTLVFTKQLLRP
jgi:ribosomal protein L11 methyltransferase